jgi:hypothetical protein
MRGEKVSTTEEERDIGVAITKNLKPAAQCSKAAGKAMAVLRQTRRNFHYRDRFTFVRLYKQYVRPQLEFASQAWSPWLAGDREVFTKSVSKDMSLVHKLISNGDELFTAAGGHDGVRTRRAAAANGLAAPFARSDIPKYSFVQWSTGIVFQREQERRTVRNLSKNC